MLFRSEDALQFLSDVKEQLHEYEESDNLLNGDGDVLNRDISFEEVRRVVSNLKYKKAVGVDMIPNEILKDNCVILALQCLFQKCFQFGHIPSIWLKAIVFPVPKSATKDPYIPLNYRGISLLSCISKVYSSVLNNRIMEYYEHAEILVDEQNGFRKKRSCEDHIFVLSSIIRNRQAQGLSTFVAFIDMEKAFDCIIRDMLLYKLLQYDIVGRMYFAIKSLYFGTMAAIQLTCGQTSWFNTAFGVRQGDVLSFTDVMICYLEFLYSKISNLQEIAWKAAVDSKPKLRTYALFKENFCTEKYVLSMLSRKQRSLLAQLRLGVLPLRIETGRYRRLAVEQRICELCNLNVVEDELHFIFTCPLYGAIRPNLLRQVENSNVNFQTLSEIGKLKSMMQNNIFSLSKYIEAAWNIRTKHLFN